MQCIGRLLIETSYANTGNINTDTWEGQKAMDNENYKDKDKVGIIYELKFNRRYV